MAEELYVNMDADRATRYAEIIPQINALVSGETDQTANLGNIMAVLKSTFGWLWVGVYLVKDENELVLGPFQGPLACTRIRLGKGVCGTVWENGKTEIVPNVEAFPGHIACSSLSKSEIVLPIIKGNKVVGVLDVDSDKLDQFDMVDANNLSIICETLASCIYD